MIASIGLKSEAVDVTSVSWAFTLTNGKRPIGIFCNAAATINGALMGDAAEIAWILPVGFSPLAFKSINTTSTTKTGMRIIYG